MVGNGVTDYNYDTEDAAAETMANFNIIPMTMWE